MVFWMVFSDLQISITMYCHDSWVPQNLVLISVIKTEILDNNKKVILGHKAYVDNDGIMI